MTSRFLFLLLHICMFVCVSQDEVDDDDELHVDEQDVAALQRSLKRSQLLLDEMCSKASVAKAALEDREVQVTELQTVS